VVTQNDRDGGHGVNGSPLPASVELLWIPLGAGASVVRLSGRAFEGLSASLRRRRRCDLYHSALVVTVPAGRYTIEMAPAPDHDGDRRGVVAEGAVGARWAGRLRIFRYEIRCWRDGVIPDAGAAVGGPLRLSDDPATAQQLVDLAPSVPTPVWGRDGLGVGDMWNSNSVTSWLLTNAGIDATMLHPPPQGRAPGWTAGLVVSQRESTGSLGRRRPDGPLGARLGQEGQGLPVVAGRRGRG
jgi:hypothetical protein